MSNVSLPRGLRNNNPLNIRRGQPWLGLRSWITDDEFCEFDNLIYGYRAALVCIRRYIEVYHCDTIRTIVSRWAPASENNVAAYVRSVQTDSGIPADYHIRFDDTATVCAVVAAMQHHECGVALGTGIVAYTYRTFFS